jgi:hypothetical protein
MSKRSQYGNDDEEGEKHRRKRRKSSDEEESEVEEEDELGNRKKSTRKVTADDYNSDSEDEAFHSDSSEDDFVRKEDKEEIERRKELEEVRRPDEEGKRRLEMDGVAFDDMQHDEDESEEEMPMEAFHMREEFQTGQISANGEFVVDATKDRQADERDAWMEGYSKQDIEKARIAQQEQRKMWQHRRTNGTSTTGQDLEKLISLLEPSENPTEALQRLARQTRLVFRKDHIQDITATCMHLMSHGNIADIYDQVREQLIRRYNHLTGKNYVHASPQYEYRFPGQDDKIHGPFSKDQMEEWREYLDETAQVRLLGSSGFYDFDQLLPAGRR